MRISRFTQTLLASLFLSIILMQILIFGLRRKLGLFFYEELFNYAFFISVVPAIGFVLVQLVIDVFRPFYFQLRGLTLKPVDASKLVRNYKELCSQFQLEKYPLISIADVSVPFSLGVHKGKSMIIIPEFLLTFTCEERESVIVHELWHIKTDVEAIYLRLFEIVSTALLTLTCGFTFLSIMFEHRILGWWTKEVFIEILGTTIPIDLYFENFFWIVFLSIAFPLCFRILVRVLRPFTGYPVYLHYDHREHLADLYASLITGKPETMARTIEKTDRYASLHKIFGKSFVSKIGFVSPVPNAKAVKQIFKRKEPPLKDQRISLLYILDKMLKTNIKLTWKREPDKLSTKLILGFLFFASRISYGKVFVSIPRDQRTKIIKYAWNNRDNFNLRNCAKETKSSIDNTLLVFYLLLRQEIIKIPEYN